jgi:asparagine synthase (glutamine-hydrolysing)
MCGIAGSYQIDPARPATGERIHAALQCIAHRGPDDEGVYARGRAVLGHRRLSVIDTSPAGHQPFTLEADRYTIVFNGEVFNFQALRAELEASGHRFRSRTDTEVVLRLFTVKGPAFLHDLNGFFALAIHDAATDTLFLARDRYGVKPLLWCEADGRFLFGSELRALTAMGAPRTVDSASVEQLFCTSSYLPRPPSKPAYTNCCPAMPCTWMPQACAKSGGTTCPMPSARHPRGMRGSRPCMRATR